MVKVKPHPDYPPEEGRYIRGNDFSPAVAIILISRVMEKHKLRMLFFFGGISLGRLSYYNALWEPDNCGKDRPYN
jgi:hypothetical protein